MTRLDLYILVPIGYVCNDGGSTVSFPLRWWIFLSVIGMKIESQSLPSLHDFHPFWAWAATSDSGRPDRSGDLMKDSECNEESGAYAFISMRLSFFAYGSE